MHVRARGLRAFRSRPASRRQRSDLVTLAHIREQFALSLGSYGCPRMTEELKELGVEDGHRVPETTQRLYASHGLWVAILFARLSESPAPARVHDIDVRKGQFL